VNKCRQHDIIPDLMANSSAGQRGTVVLAGGEMVFIDGAKLVYDSKSKYYHDMNSTNHKKLLREKLISSATWCSCN
jgi:hypothetical protein